MVGKLDLLNKTNMVDFALDVYQRIHPDQEVPEEYLERRENVVAQMKEMKKATGLIMEVFGRDDVTELINSGPEPKALFDYVATNHGITQENVDTLFHCAKMYYECGNYSGADQYLVFHRMLISPNDKLYLGNLWGKFACEILMQNWEQALEEQARLKEFIDQYPHFAPLELLQQRTWFIHWSLFIYFNHANGRDMLIELISEKKNNKVPPYYLNAVETLAPHILRYLAVAAITHRKRRDLIKDLVRIIQQEAYTYRDAVTDFVQCLCVQFDFDGAQQKLKECAELFENDYFLASYQDEFMESARLFMFETFCRIHECVTIK